MTPAAKILLPVGGAILGAAIGELFREGSHHSPGAVGGVAGLVLGAGLAAILPRTVEIEQGKRYRVTSPMPVEGDRPTVFLGLAAIGAVVTTLGPPDLVYELTSTKTRTLVLGHDSFDFAEPLTGRDVTLRVDRVEEIPA
jgi:hypothetical protein